MKINLTSLISTLGKELKSTLQLLVYLNKVIPFFNKKTTSEKLEPSIDPIVVEPAPSSPVPEEAQSSFDSSTPDTSAPKKRGRTSKKSTKNKDPEVEVELEGQTSTSNPGQETAEASQDTILTVEGTQSPPPLQRKKRLIAMVGFCFLIGTGIGGYTLYKYERSSDTPKTVPMVVQPIPGSLQPPLNLAEANGFMATINPQFLLDKPQSDAPIPRVSLILYDVGGNTNTHEEMDVASLDLPEEVAFALNPYADNLNELLLDIKSLGHTTLLQMPWEDDTPYEDQGNLTVLAQQREDLLLDNLQNLLELSSGTSGFFVHKGATLMRQPKVLNLTLHYIAKNKNMLIAPPDTLMTNLHLVAAQNKLNYACITLLEPKLTDLKALTALAQRTGFVILAFPMKKNVQATINDWIIKAEEAKLSLVPLSDILPLSETRQ